MRLVTVIRLTLAGAGIAGLAIVGLAPVGAQAPLDTLPSRAPALVAPPGAWLVQDFARPGLGAWHPDRPGVWSVTHGMLRAQLPDARQQHSFLYAGDSTWTDYALDAYVCGMRGVDKGFAVRVRNGRGLGVDLRGPGYQDVKLNLNQIPIASGPVQNANGTWHHVRIEIQGARCRLLVDGDVVLDRRVAWRLPGAGGIALAAYTGGVGQCTVYYDNVVVSPLPAATAEGATR